MYQLCLLYMLIIAFTVCPTLMVNHPFLPTCLGVAFTSEIASKQSRAPPQAFSLIHEEALGVLNRELYHNSVIVFHFAPHSNTPYLIFGARFYVSKSHLWTQNIKCKENIVETHIAFAFACVFLNVLNICNISGGKRNN